jgi:hypothetical protein
MEGEAFGADGVSEELVRTESGPVMLVDDGNQSNVVQMNGPARQMTSRTKQDSTATL